MTGDQRPSRYRAYLLRCWQERGRQEAQPALWRFSLEDPHTGRRYGFATLDAVLAALQRELVADDAPSPAGISEHPTTQHEKEARSP